MVKVKICGLRVAREICFINQVLPDYAGFVFAPSRRRITPFEAARLIDALDTKILPVGVFVNEAVDTIVRTVRLCGLRVVQLHGEEGPEVLEALRFNISSGVELWKSLKMPYASKTQRPLLHEIPGLTPGSWDRILYDGALPGSGIPLNLGLLPSSLENCILAGGLSPANINEILQKTNPYGVDVSTGVEGADGFKDLALIIKFIEAIRNKEERQ